MPTSGRITYWESIASATTLDLIRQQRNGVELTISGLLHGETVVSILNAEPGGFVLGFSSGRLAHMSVRDGQGRPDISLKFLRGAAGSASGGLFGSLRNALSSSAWKGDLAAVRAGPVSKPGERDVVSVTSKGKLQAWYLLRGGSHTQHADADIREGIVTELKASNPDLKDLLIESFEVLDFTFAPNPPIADDEQSDSIDAGTHLLLLTSLGGRGSSHYALVQVLVKETTLDVGMIRHIHSYTSPLNHSAVCKPRLYLPNPGVVAFLVFDRAVVVASMARQPDSPELQLLSESHIQTQSFEDVVDFRVDKGVEITGSGFEEPHLTSHSQEDSKSRRHKARYPAAMLLVKSGGVIRVAATNLHKFAGNAAPQVSAKSKLEQAVFFGTLANNPLKFGGRSELKFPDEEIGQAALALSHEILSSTTTYIPALIASIEDNLERRSTALRALATHLKETNVSLDRVTRWKLLWDAEKLAGAKSVWERYDASVKQKAVGQKKGIMGDIVDHIHERYKAELVEEAGELDQVRHWFINDIYRLQIAIPWAYQVVKYTYQDGEVDHAGVVTLTSEADDFVIRALEGAFDFRQNNLKLYGLQQEELENGILKTGYDGLPEFWTSTVLISENLKKQTDLARSLATEYWQTSGGEGLPDPVEVNKIRVENIQLVDLCTRCTTERYRWLLAQDDPRLKDMGENLLSSSTIVEHTQISFLADLGLVDDALKLAEKHRIYTALAQILVEEMERVVGEGGPPREDETPLTRRGMYLEKLVKRYFDIFGTYFATAFYRYYIQRGELFAMLDDNDHPKQLTNFLRSRPEYAKVAWINEVTQNEDFDRAAKTLLELGLRRERNIWTKKVELSIGKLARLAGKKYSEAGGLIIPDGGQSELIEAKRQIELAQIQDKIFAHVQPAISNAIDEGAELQLAMEVYGSSDLNDKPALFHLLEENMRSLIGHQALPALQIVDLLTLMGSNGNPEEHGPIDGQEFYLAIQALRYGPLDKADQSLTERVIWRRCMIRDDWFDINNTDLKDDEQVSRQLQRTALYSTLRACIKNRE
jgi:nuclear pore complex protein Nup133